MRIVARFQLTTPSRDEDIANRISSVMDAWAERKFSMNSAGEMTIRKSGRTASLDNQVESVGNQSRFSFTTLEEIDAGTLQTEIGFVKSVDRTAFRCIISVGSDGGVAPTDVSLIAPRFMRDIIAIDTPWTIGRLGERVFHHSFTVSKENIEQLEELIQASERRLPIVVVSELGGQVLADDIHERIIQDVCGLAHVVRLSDQGSWELTRRQGKEWSCYNGAIRLFWPFRTNKQDYRLHPLWTLDQVLSRATSRLQACNQIRIVIAQEIIEASTFVADDPAFREFDSAKLRHVVDQVRNAASYDNDSQALAEAYAAENDVLRQTVDKQENELEILRSNIETLTVGLRVSTASLSEVDSVAPPETVGEAVSIAKRELGGRVVIADETASDISDLNELAGPPDKVLRYLRTLGQMADAIRLGPLGRSIPIWLREHGVECSVESETSKVSKDARRFRSRKVNGEDVDCEFHAKPAEGVSPDMCVRIYFAVFQSAPFVKVGYIGRHST